MIGKLKLKGVINTACQTFLNTLNVSNFFLVKSEVY